ncbi:toxin-antitoxin system YwqK family antitoxin [Salinimicrobium oceani]|uniref:Aspartic peptidase n=1 Tax=Salinimicrobium oceani TaxID=2722702 RepID=A0ABX1CTS1_9FLAO|nr:aspartic peptidase [Salinimicrobium oceani]NJW51680.1 aspartic peptidase [Salinimicrobium oceani]
MLFKRNWELVICILIYTINNTAIAQEVNTFDSQGNKHGKWKEYFDSGKEMLKYEGEFIHGKETGMFKFYQEGLKQPAALMHFSPSHDTIRATYLSQRGKTISEGKLLNKQRTGTWKYYHKDLDRVMMIENYEAGKLHGDRKIFYEDGTLAEEAHYVAGELHGSRKLLSVKGVVLEDLQYVNGELHGPAKFYNGKGVLMSEGAYKRNKHHGTWRYYEQGKLKREKQY